MKPVADNQDAAQAKYALERAMLGGRDWQLFAGDTLLTTITGENSELSVEWGKLIFAWWDGEQSQSWRVTAYEIEAAELRLQVTRGMARELTTLTLRDQARWRVQAEFEGLELGERRQAYSELMLRLLTNHFGNARVQRMDSGAGPPRVAAALPGKYARLVLKPCNKTFLAIGAGEAESQADIDAVVAAGLIWLANFNQRRENKDRAVKLLFCLPRGHAQTAIERLTLLDVSHLSAGLECFELDARGEELTALPLASQDELLNTHPRDLDWPEADPTDDKWRGRILRLAPELIEARRVARRVSYSINGLEFARLNLGENPQTFFGVAGLREDRQLTRVAPGTERLSEANFNQLERLVGEIVKYRSANTPDRRHPFYRLREEAWLESLLRRDISTLDAGFDQRFVYSQIPAWRGDDRSVIDLLTVKYEPGEGARLAVIEIKASEDLQLPLQGLDYWLRVEQARIRGDFIRRGLFAGIKIADKPPLLYLVAPRLRFHRTFSHIAGCLSRQIEAFQVGVNANWRGGIRIRSIERINLMEQTVELPE